MRTLPPPPHLHVCFIFFIFSVFFVFQDEAEAMVNRSVPPIICEEEKEEEIVSIEVRIKMASNLIARFHERQHKCLFESISINLSLSTKAHLALNLDSPSKPTPPTLAAYVASGPNEKPFFISDISYHETRKPFVVSRNISEDSFVCLNSSSL
ncbi:hypothetical protein PVL29_002459 [Vitis rotundifolia]|uniref:Uncharacterized protein n=1 Tax=Vitis rotundifolia TaxID=103349 RepID=A0AA39AI19_VITRO|nr:hypothetical protein PVL29_002459 [Vitis rotundifolia]